MEVEVDRKEIWMGVFGGRSGCDAVLVVAQVVVQVGELGEDVLVVAGSFLDVANYRLGLGLELVHLGVELAPKAISNTGCRCPGQWPSRKRRFCRW